MRGLRHRVGLGWIDVFAWMVLASVVGGIATANPLSAWANAGNLDPKLDYRITYQTGSKRFLVVYLGGYATPGYIEMSH